jgi:hypothetical protein
MEFKLGDWLILDKKYLCRVDDIEEDNPLVIYLRWFVDDDHDTYSFQTIRPEHHHITKITKEVADIMIGV